MKKILSNFIVPFSLLTGMIFIHAGAMKDFSRKEKSSRNSTLIYSIEDSIEGEVKVEDSPNVENYYSQLLEVMKFIESSNNPSKYNPEEEAAGILQVRPILLKDVNDHIGYEKFTLEDRWSEEKSVLIFLAYQSYYNPEGSYEKAARCWNGGPTGHEKICTLKYWNKIKDSL